MSTESAPIDAVGARLIRCLQLAPRLPFSAAAEVLGVSEQTVARRYRRLVNDGILRVTAVVNPTALGQNNWMVRVQCRPSGAPSLAQALAQRDDISWVTLASGGAEVVCVLRARTSEARDDLLTQKLPRTAPVLGMSAAMVLHRFIGGGMHSTDDWTALAESLDDAQQAAVLEHAHVLLPDEVAGGFELKPPDALLLDALMHDGRASYGTLAAAAGITEARAKRRLNTLIQRGVAYFDVDLSADALGFHTLATLWMTVTPAELDRVGDALSREREVAYAAAITGPQNITASILCRDVSDLYRFATAKVGAIPGVQTMEISPVLRHVKQAGALTTGDRLISS